MTNTNSQAAMDNQQLEDLVAQVDTGVRNPKSLVGLLLVAVALCWSFFQLYIASPFPFWLSDLLGINLTIDDTRARSIHLAFAVFLGFAAYPAYLHKKQPLKKLAALIFLIAGGYITFVQIENFILIKSVLIQHEEISNNIFHLYGYAGLFICLIFHPLTIGFIKKTDERSSSIGFLVGLSALSYWAFQFYQLDAVAKTLSGEVVTFKDFQVYCAMAVGGILLLLLSYPAFDKPSRSKISAPDWLCALGASFAAAYLFSFYNELATRPGNPSTFDLIITVTGIATLLEATRRSLGPPLTIVALVFLGYTFFAPYMPEIIANKAFSLHRVASHQWLTTEGVFGIALGVSTKFVFLFVLFGSLLDKGGAGNYFIKLAFSMVGHLKGGPAKAAVVSSGMTGLISGSSIANVVTTGTFTIPLMRRVGFTGEKAGAVEVSSSVNGQLMPPVMGAAAFLMVEYVGIPYLEVIKHAFIPALISYIALIYIVHLEAMKADMPCLEKSGAAYSLKYKLIHNGFYLSGFFILFGMAYYSTKYIHILFPEYGRSIIIFGLIVLYIWGVQAASKHPKLEADDPTKPLVQMPDFYQVFPVGLYYFLPVFVLVWNLMVERLSPAMSASYAIFLMIFINLSQPLLESFFRGSNEYLKAFKEGWYNLYAGLLSGARNMIGIAIATATAGIIVGTVSLTGIGFIMTEFVEFISGGNLILMLVFTAIISLILGMGLPTTANYIVVSALMAPVIVTLGAQSGLLIPLIAVHLFVFYFGIMADVTPPVGLASFAAAAVSGADPIKTGFTAFYYSLRTVALPFIFIFNTQLLLIGISGPLDLIITIVTATVAMLIFAAGTQGFFITKNKQIENILLLLVAFTLFRPGFWMDMVYPPYERVEPQKIYETIDSIKSEEELRLVAQGSTLDGNYMKTTLAIPIIQKINDKGKPLTGEQRLAEIGLYLNVTKEDVTVDRSDYGSIAQKKGLDFGWEILYLERLSARPAKELFFIPALALLLIIIRIQKRRKEKNL